ncbi:hypothetical protein AQUCO_11500006v1 [Aquilegia coerulea]|uniref:Acidic protein n=1 Tax=Aquilegia coerulea TaxID=218851 RepID=A0A2G5C288_AQUCA|nr:hypothetical protein AQUCO_11500006v1 [Aquilegia coerulea]
MSAAFDAPSCSKIKATLLLIVIFLACTIRNVTSQGDFQCMTQCGTQMGSCYPTCAKKADHAQVSMCMSTCITNGLQCLMKCKQFISSPPSSQIGN